MPLFPAPAGMIPDLQNLRALPQTFPRTRGDDPPNANPKEA